MQINKTSINLQKYSSTSPIKLSKITNPNGSLFLSQAPGKKISTGRNGLKYDRNLKDDLTEITKTAKIKTIICLLNKYELRTIGVDLTEYELICKFLSIELLIFPIVEMGVPEIDPVSFADKIVSYVVFLLNKGDNVLIHCRGGIGRAGMVACCALIHLKECENAEDAVKKVRRIRDKRCVESKKQYDYIVMFASLCKKSKN